MIAQKPVDEVKLALRRQERLTELEPSIARQLEAGNSASYTVNGETVRELPDGQRFIVRSVDGGRSESRVREVLSAAEQARIQVFVDDPDGAVARARAFGTDVSQTVRNALLTPEERWRRANATIARTQKLFGSAKRGRASSG